MKAPDLTNALIVEDDVHTVALISALLRRFGFEIYTADNGSDALSVLESAVPLGLIILDILLPGLSGLKVLEVLREQHPNIPVLIVSAHIDTNKTALGEVEGIPRLIKPFSKQQFDEAIQRLVIPSS